MLQKETRIMRGPNMWSDSVNRLIVIKLDFNDYDHELLVRKLQPFVEKGQDNFYLALASFIAKNGAEIQGHPEGFASGARLLGESSYYSFFEYEIEELGLDAAEGVCKALEDYLNDKSELSFGKLKDSLTWLYNKYKLGPSTATIVKAAHSRGITCKGLPGGLIRLGQGAHQKRISASIVESTSDIAVDVAGDKELTKKLLEAALIPVPKGVLVRQESSLEEVSVELGYPLVTKPLDGHQGKGITSDITQFSTLVNGFREAKKHSNAVIVERHIKGDDYRFLVVGYKFIAAAKRVPACVMGDGKSSIKQLVELVNTDPKRGDGHSTVLTKIFIDQQTVSLLESRNLTVDSVPEAGEWIYLKDTANLSTGGTAIDVTDKVHPENILLAERAARIVGLDICGIDIMAPDVKTPIRQNGGAILEVNAAPGLRMHIAPSFGKPRNVGDPIIDVLFPDGKYRIPIVAVTGTNGKTTTSRLMAYIAQQAGFSVGFTSTDGINLNDIIIFEGDCSGPKSSEVILNDPTVEFAVFECARGGIIRSGLAFSECDVAIVTNVAEDHLGLKDIYTVEDLAAVKSVVPRSVSPHGHAILNASNDLVYAMKDKVKGKIGLFSLDAQNKRIEEHCIAGGSAIYLDDQNNIVIRKGEEKIIVENVVNIPLTVKGMADFMIENTMAAVLGSYLYGISLDIIRKSIRQFKPSAELTPGRLNLFDVNSVNVIVDYAHNPHGLNALARLLTQIQAKKTGIVTGLGDRRDQDIVEVGKIAADMYDEVVVRIDKDSRGRQPEEIFRLIESGVREKSSVTKVHLIPDSTEALKFAIGNSSKDDYVVISADDAIKTVAIVQKLEKEALELAELSKA